ncbi:uncharacterized protein EV420DRAFT_1770362 [Desarmillaria tabescens]|uniref:Uncharacterized protein n=1 Tax=Armillaria tabescens TaxID=1929756 RepID=A0AA39J4U6_ARMTA|nr:uncharacterized protein EV420DRAFT_1770362 [Desarmillaria tabescens]KAK0436177.1 hypothetical protein EV420DRAFT_1770362 [Desarmillaria tabescens]
MPKASTKSTDPDGTEEILRSDATKRYRVKPVDLDTLRPVRTERGYKNSLVRYYDTGDVEALEQQLKQDPSLSKVHTSPKKTVKKKGGKISRTTAMRNFNLDDAQMDRIKPRDVKDSPTKKDAHRKVFWYNLVDVENLAQEVHRTTSRDKRGSDDKKSTKELSHQASTSTSVTSKVKMKDDSDDEVIVVSMSPSQAKKSGKSSIKQKSEDDDEVIVVSESRKSPDRKNVHVKRNYDYDDDLIADGLFDGLANDDAAALFASLTR